MRPLAEILLNALEHWDGQKASEPALCIAKELITYGRFDELDDFLAMISSTPPWNASSTRYVRSKIAPLILNHYIYRVPDISHSVIDMYWAQQEMAKPISQAMTRKGSLQATVETLKHRLIQLSKQNL